MHPRGKHPQAQGFVYKNNPYPDNPRHYQRADVASYQLSGSTAPGGMRNLHHHPSAHPAQPSTPPTPQDLKQPTHMQQTHSLTQQPGQLWTANARNNTGGQPYGYPRPQQGSQRVPQTRQVVLQPNNGQPMMQQQVSLPYGTPCIQTIQGQQVFIPHNAPYATLQQQSRPNMYPYVIQAPSNFYSGPFQPPNFYVQQQIQGPIQSNPGPPPPTQGAPMQQPMPRSTPMSSNNQGTTRRKNALRIIDPNTGKDVIEELYENGTTPPRSGESSSRQTPQPSCVQSNDQSLAAEFAARVAIAASSDNSSPNSLGPQQPSSRTSNYSESDSQPSPDPQAMSPPGLGSSKLVTSVENIANDNQLPDESCYDPPNPPMMMGRWPTMEYMPIVLGPDNPQQLPVQWVVPEGSPIPVIINKELQQQVLEQQPRPTPVVSALTNAPPVDIPPRTQSNQFPIHKGGHQSPGRRKPRNEPNLENIQSQQQNREIPKNLIKDTPPSVKQPYQPPMLQQQKVPVQVLQQQQQQQQQQPLPPLLQQQKPPLLLQQPPQPILLQQQPLPQILPQQWQQPQPLNKQPIDSNKMTIPSQESNIEIVQSLQNLKISEKETEDNNKLDVNQNNSELVRNDVTKSVSREHSPAPVVTGKLPAPVASTDHSAKSNNKSKANKKQQPPQQQPTAANKTKQENNEVNENKKKANENESTNGMVAKEEAPEIDQVDNIQVTDIDADTDVVSVKNEENNKQLINQINDENEDVDGDDDDQLGVDSAKPVLKHSYKDDQWSPINPDGKKKYERDFLLELQMDPQSKKKPENLPDLDLLRDNSRRVNMDRNFMNTLSRNDSLMPSFANKSSSMRGLAPSKRGSQQGKPNKSNKPQMIHLNLSLHEDVKLNETENAWRPARIRNKDEMTEFETKTEELYKKVRGVLNKLTPQKFTKLVGQVKILPIDNCSRLQGVIDLVFEKAVDEPSYSVAYAKMCRTLETMAVTDDPKPDGGEPKPVNFKKLLLTRCQREFEKNKSDELNRDVRLKQIEAETDPEKKGELQAMYEEDERKLRMRSVGTIRFIGELYKLQMLTAPIMHRCLLQLLNDGDEESLECLCKLITTIGKDLEIVQKSIKPNHTRDPNFDLNQYCKRLEDIVRTKRTSGCSRISNRIRFMIQDVLDLRAMDWVPRRDEGNPKTIDQIQKDADRESAETLLSMNSPMDRNKRQDSRNSMDRKSRNDPRDASGWTTVQSSNKKYSIESSKLMVNPTDIDIGRSLSLGTPAQFSNWHKGSAGGSSQVEGNKLSPMSSSNIYSVLEERGGPPPLSRTGSSGYKVPMKQSPQDEPRLSRSGSTQGTSSRSGSRDSSKTDDRKYTGVQSKSQQGAPVLTPPPSAPELQPLSQEEVRKRVKLLVEEYCSDQNLEEATVTLQDKFSPLDYEELVFSAMTETLDKSCKQRRALGMLLHYFIRNKNISLDHYLLGLSRVVEQSEDLICDVPKIWDYYAESVVDLLKQETISFKHVFDILTPFKSDQKGVSSMLLCLLKTLEKEKGGNWLKSVWDASGVQLSLLVENAEKFIEENKLEQILFTSSDSGAAELSMDDIGESIYAMLSSSANFDYVNEWIDKNVGDRKTDPQFTRVLTTAILKKSCIQPNNSCSLNEDTFSNYENFLKRYTDNDQKRDLACLYAIQAFDHKNEHPSGFVPKIFLYLWESNIISFESFIAWRDSSDPQEVDGKGVAVKSLTSFYTQIDEQMESDEDS